MNRVRKQYQESVVPALMKEFKYTTPMQVPRLVKIVLNSAVGEATVNGKAIQHSEYAMRQIAGQKPVITKGKKAISNFKLKLGQPIGVMVTLRRDRMYSFFDRLVAVALPRVRDFRGITRRGFDGRGNFTLGIKEQLVFPEVDVDQLDKIRGMNVTFVTTAKTDAEALALLTQLGMPFRAK